MGITETARLLDGLEEKWEGLHIPRYRFKRLCSEERGVFFDCSTEPERCLEDVMARTDYPRFSVYLLVRGNDGELTVEEVSFANPGGETLERFVKRYPTQLRPAGALAYQLNGRELVDYLGASYEG